MHIKPISGRAHEPSSSLIKQAGYVSLANRATFNNNERVPIVTSELVQCRARVELSRAGIERAVECVGSFIGLNLGRHNKKR